MGIQCQNFREHYIELTRNVRDLVNTTHPNTTVLFYAVSCTAYKDLCQNNNISGFPRIKVYPAGSTAPQDAFPNKLHPFQIMNLLGMEAPELENATTAVMSTESLASQALSVLLDHKPPPRSIRQQTFADALLSFDFTMRHGVYMQSGPLADIKQQALKNWLKLLEKTIPPTWLRFHRLLRALLDEWEEIIKSEANLMSVMNRFPLQQSTWSPACTRAGTGYTCGLWKLFHIVSVGLLEWNQHARHRTVSAKTAGDTLRNFVEHFFGCDVCRTHFVQAYDSCELLDKCERLKDVPKMARWREFPLWLFEMHNAVNVRLMKEQQSDKKSWTSEEEAAKKWPPKSECPKCWNKDGTHDPTVVLRHLRMEYW